MNRNICRLLVVVGLVLLTRQNSLAQDSIPYVPSPMYVVHKMIEVAEIKKGDILYDMGSGDGRIVIEAAKKFGIRGVGIDLNPELVAKAKANALEEGVSDLVEFRAQDAFTVDMSPATVLTLYMLPEFNAKLRPIMDRQLKPGTRVVSHDYPVEGWVPTRQESVPGTFVHDHSVMLFEIR